SRRTGTRAAALVAALVLVAAACGDDDASDDTRAPESSSPTSSAATEPTSSAAEEPSAAPATPSGEPLRVAQWGPSEDFTALQELFGAARAAVATINAAGGIPDPAGGPNRPLELVECRISPA